MNSALQSLHNFVMDEGRGWYSRGYLPHIDSAGRTQFLTWRLDDALPAHVIHKWKQELVNLTDEKRKAELMRRIEAYCDAGHGSCVLRDPRAAKAAQDVLLRLHAEMYKLHAWVVMPNHVHALLTPKPEVSLGEVLKRVKGASSREVNLALKRTGRFWETDYFDRLIRNQEHFNAVANYIEWNAVKAKLIPDPKLWLWSSANPENQRRLEEKS